MALQWTRYTGLAAARPPAASSAVACARSQAAPLNWGVRHNERWHVYRPLARRVDPAPGGGRLRPPRPAGLGGRAGPHRPGGLHGRARGGDDRYRRYRFAVVARYTNRTSAPVYLDRCGPDGRTPRYGVGLAGDRPGRSAYHPPRWVCRGRGAVAGPMRLWYPVHACRGELGCLLPDSLGGRTRSRSASRRARGRRRAPMPNAALQRTRAAGLAPARPSATS
jgi:hypothetical protein